MKKTLFSLFVLAILAVAGIALFLCGDLHGTQKMRIQTATPYQIANAMLGDYFYTNYRESTLIVQGTVVSVNMQNGNLIVGLTTSSTYQAFCNLGTSSSTIQVGDTIRVLAEGAIAEREPTAVLLEGCVAI